MSIAAAAAEVGIAAEELLLWIDNNKPGRNPLLERANSLSQRRVCSACGKEIVAFEQYCSAGAYSYHQSCGRRIMFGR
jgi:hypothetical protein